MAFLGWHIVALVAFVCFFSKMCFCVSFKISFMRGRIVTSVTLKRLFPCVQFQMSPQTLCTGKGKPTMTTFVLLLSVARFQMRFQSIWTREGFFTMTAFVQCFFQMRCQMFHQNAYVRWWKNTLVTSAWTFAILSCHIWIFHLQDFIGRRKIWIMENGESR